MERGAFTLIELLVVIAIISVLATMRSERVNLAFMDGHRKALRMEQFYVGQTPPQKFSTP